MSSTSSPEYIYKILPPPAPPSPLPAVLPVSPLDSGDGFVHLSTAAQVLGTLRAFFGDVHEVYILRIPYARVAAEIRWEAPGGPQNSCGTDGSRDGEGLFPHLYNGLKLGREQVDCVGKWERGEGWEVGGGALSGWDKEVHLV